MILSICNLIFTFVLVFCIHNFVSFSLKRASKLHLGQACDSWSHLVCTGVCRADMGSSVGSRTQALTLFTYCHQFCFLATRPAHHSVPWAGDQGATRLLVCGGVTHQGTLTSVTVTPAPQPVLPRTCSSLTSPYRGERCRGRR